MGTEPFSGGFYKNPAQVWVKSQMVLKSGNQGNMIISTGLPPEGRASPQEILSQQPWSTPTQHSGANSPEPGGFSSSKFSFPGAWPRILEIMVIIADIPPLQISPPRLRPHRCLDISVPGTICLMRRKGREERGVREGLGQRDHINSQASSQAGDCHFLLEPLDIERVRLMQKGKGRHIKLRDWLAPLCYCYVFTS